MVQGLPSLNCFVCVVVVINYYVAHWTDMRLLVERYHWTELHDCRIMELKSLSPAYPTTPNSHLGSFYRCLVFVVDRVAISLAAFACLIYCEGGRFFLLHDGRAIYK
jgi:hypothetical protein